VALSVALVQDATSAVPLQQNALQQGVVVAPQNPQPIISPVVQEVCLQPVLLQPGDQPVPPPPDLPVFLQNQQVTGVAQPAMASEQHSAASATVKNAAEKQQLATGEDSAAPEECSFSSDNHQAEEEEDPDAEDNEQLQFDAEISGIAGYLQHDNGVDEHHQKWLHYISEKEELMGASIIKGKGSNSITWTV